MAKITARHKLPGRLQEVAMLHVFAVSLIFALEASLHLNQEMLEALPHREAYRPGPDKPGASPSHVL